MRERESECERESESESEREKQSKGHIAPYCHMNLKKNIYVYNKIINFFLE